MPQAHYLTLKSRDFSKIVWARNILRLYFPACMLNYNHKPERVKGSEVVYGLQLMFRDAGQQNYGKVLTSGIEMVLSLRRHIAPGLVLANDEPIRGIPDQIIRKFISLDLS